MEAGTDAEAMLLTGLLPMAHSACFLIEPAQDGPTYNRLGPPPPITKYKTMPYRFAYSPVLWGIFLIEIASFSVTLACVKLTQN